MIFEGHREATEPICKSQHCPLRLSLSGASNWKSQYPGLPPLAFVTRENSHQSPRLQQTFSAFPASPLDDLTLLLITPSINLQPPHHHHPNPSSVFAWTLQQAPPAHIVTAQLKPSHLSPRDCNTILLSRQLSFLSQLFSKNSFNNTLGPHVL